MKARITVRSVEALKPKRGQRQKLWDDQIRGFGCVAMPSGQRRFVLYRQVKATGKRRSWPLGEFPAVSPDQARKKALSLVAQIADGQDPMADTGSRGSVPTVQDLWDRYLEHIKTRTKPRPKKPRSIAEDERNYSNHVKCVLGDRPVASVMHDDVEALHAAISRQHPVAANRVRALVSAMFNVAEVPRVKGEPPWRTPGTNPARNVRKNPEQGREGELSPAELQRLGKALANFEDETPTKAAAIATHASVVAAIKLLLYSGARKSEILELEWKNVDIEGGRLVLPNSKTGRKVIHLNSQAVAVLNGIEGDRVGYVLRGARPGKHLVNPWKAWNRIRKSAGIPDAHLHDLRHTFGCTGVGGGQSLEIIGQQLGHKSTKTTKLYARAATNPVRAAVNEVGDALEAALESGEPRLRAVG